MFIMGIAIGLISANITYRSIYSNNTSVKSFVSLKNMSQISSKNPIQDSENSNVLELYKIMRGYINHEDSLINNRLTWLLTIQGLLFTGYGLALRETTKSSDLISLIFILKGLGLATSFLGFTGILAASLAIREVERKWLSIKPKDLLTHSIADQLPDVTGGGNRLVHFLGSFTPLSIPSIFFVAWFNLLKLWKHTWLSYLLIGLLVVLFISIFGFPSSRFKIKKRG